MRCISATTPAMTSPEPRPPGCGRSGSTRRVRPGATRLRLMARSAAWPSCRIAGRKQRLPATNNGHKKSPGAIFDVAQRRPRRGGRHGWMATKKPARGWHAGFLFYSRPLDRAAAVLAVRLFGRIRDHIRLDFLHLATTGEELFHGAGQRITLFLLGFDARQFFYVDGGFGFFAFAGGHDFVVTITIIAAVAIIGGSQLLAFVFVSAF